jgi:hypothetical protein
LQTRGKRKSIKGYAGRKEGRKEGRKMFHGICIELYGINTS